MRKPLAKLLAWLLILVVLLPGASPKPLHTVSLYAAPPPPTPAPSTDGMDAQPAQDPVSPEPGNGLAQPDEAGARQAIEAALEKYLRYWGPRYEIGPVEVAVEGEWAHGVARSASQTQAPSEPIHILAHPLPDGTWQARMPTTDGLYLQWVQALPESLVAAGLAAPLRKERPNETAQQVLALEQPTVMPTPLSSQLLVYVDPIWDYSIIYPADWKAQITFTNNDDYPPYFRQRMDLLGPNGAEIAVIVWQKQPDVGLTDWVDKNERQSLEFNGVKLPRTPNAIVAGQDALVMSRTKDCVPQIFFAYVDALDRVLLIRYTARDKGEALGIYRAVLDSVSIQGLPESSKSREDMIPELKLVTGTEECELDSSDTRCCGYPPVTRWLCSRDKVSHIQRGNCVYWAAYKRPDIGNTVADQAPPGQGSAGNWAYYAEQGGCDVDSTPRVGDIMVIENLAQPDLGHVAYVESVNEREGIVYVTEMNYCTSCPERSWSYYSSGKRFIHGCGGATCSAPSLISPADGYVHTSSDRTITFSWSPPSNCTPDGYTFRVKTVPDMNSGGITIFDEGQGGTQVTKPFGSEWDNTDLYWSVRACRPCTPYNPGPWAPPRRFRIEPGAPPQPGSWHVEYFSDTSLSNRCYDGYESSTYVFKDWAEDAPAGGCSSDNWSARFTRRVHFWSGSYTFALGSDDWGRIKVGSDTVVDNWQGRGQHYESRSLSEGDYDVTVEFADTLGHAKLAAWWWGPGFDIPHQSQDTNQWYARYWGNKDLWWDSIVQVNEGTGRLAHSWDTGGPGYGLPNDRFSSRFERLVYFDCGRYRFHIFTDDGVRFWVDGQQKLDKWFDGVNGYNVYVDLPAGSHNLKLEHYENGGSAAISLDWFLESGCAPEAPSNLTATAVSCTQINLSWQDNSTTESDYHVERSLDGSNWSQIATVSGTSYQDTGLTPQTTYYYRVRAHRHSDDRYSEYSNTANAVTQGGLPGSPTLLSPGDGSSMCNPTPTFDWANVSGATSYRIQVDNNSNFGSPEVNTTTSSSAYTPGTGLAAGTYYWRVRAVNSCGVGSWSSPWRVVISDCPEMGEGLSQVVMIQSILSYRRDLKQLPIWRPYVTCCGLGANGGGSRSSAGVDAARWLPV